MSKLCLLVGLVLSDRWLCLLHASDSSLVLFDLCACLHQGLLYCNTVVTLTTVGGAYIIYVFINSMTNKFVCVVDYGMAILSLEISNTVCNINKG